jgi:hypothetical protein
LLKNKYPTLLDYNKDFSPDKCGKYSPYPQQCHLGKANTLSQLKAAYGGTSDIQWLIPQIVYFQENMPVDKKMNSEQILALAQVISTEYYYLKTTEIMLFFSRLLGGSYKVQFFNRIDPNTIIEVLSQQFIPQRNKIFNDEIKRKQKEKEKADKDNNITWEEYCQRKNINKPNPLNSLYE